MPKNLYTALTAGKGLGVFTGSTIGVGEVVLDFKGPVLCGFEVEDENRCIQIGADRFLGPSGDLDDYVNHSCTPNCGLSCVGDGMQLVAIRDIQPGEELTFDYSTATNLGDHWSMPCCCQSPECRGIVEDFDMLPADLKAHYLGQGIVPAHILLNGSGASRRHPLELSPDVLGAGVLGSGVLPDKGEGGLVAGFNGSLAAAQSLTEGHPTFEPAEAIGNGPALIGTLGAAAGMPLQPEAAPGRLCRR